MPKHSENPPENVAQTVAGPTAAPSSPEAPPIKRGRCWKRRLTISLVIILVLLAALVGFAPSIASTPMIYNAVLGVVNGKLQGKLQLDGLRLSWGGPLEIRGLRVTDPEQQQVLHVQCVATNTGVWRLITSTLAFGEITVESPAVLIERKSDGQLTLARAFQLRQPTKPEPMGPLPAPEGRVVVKGGTIKVVRPGAGPYEISDVNGQVDLKTLSEIAGQISLTLADGSKLTAGARGVQLAADGKSLLVPEAHLESTAAQLTARDVKWKSGDKLALEGKIEATADVARCLKAAAPLAQWDKPPELAGRLTLTTSGTTAGDLLRLAGEGGIEQFAIGAGPGAVREEGVKFAYDAKLDQATQAITISKCRLESKPISAELAGTIGQYAGDCQLNLSGRYSASWEALTALLHELAPATASTVVITGKTASDFKVTGPALQARAHPSFRGLSSGAGIAWASAEIYGVKMGAAQLAPALQEGRLSLPKTTIPAGDGQVNVRAVVDFQPQDPTLQMPGKTQLLANVPVTKELGAQLLSRINPIFLHVADIQGRANLGVEDVSLPLGESVRQRGVGRGRLDLSQMKMRPSGVLAELIALGGMSADNAYAAETGPVDFIVKDGRIWYDDFTLTFPENFDLKFRGSVGLDETLDLVVSVPLRSALLDKLGAKGPTQEYARMLASTRVDLPIVGTREKPQLDMSKVDVQALLKDVLKQEPAKQLEGILRGFQGGQKEKP